ncbi:hypothetical protein KW882_03425 [Vibrio parahaemolyticus]
MEKESNNSVKFMANPLLVMAEVALIDWWLKPIMALIYSFSAFTLRKQLSEKVSDKLSEQGFELNSATSKFSDVNKYSLLKDIEIQFYTKNPIRFCVLGMAFIVLSGNVPDFSSASLNLSGGWVKELGYLLLGVSVVFYFIGRWQMYKINRIFH